MYQCKQCGEDFISSRLDFICASTCSSCFQKSNPVAPTLNKRKNKLHRAKSFTNNFLIPIDYPHESASCSSMRKEIDVREIPVPLKKAKITSTASDDYLGSKDNIVSESSYFCKEDIREVICIELVDKEETVKEIPAPLKKDNVICTISDGYLRSKESIAYESSSFCKEDIREVICNEFVDKEETVKEIPAPLKKENVTCTIGDDYLRSKDNIISESSSLCKEDITKVRCNELVDIEETVFAENSVMQSEKDTEKLNMHRKEFDNPTDHSTGSTKRHSGEDMVKENMKLCDFSIKDSDTKHFGDGQSCFRDDSSSPDHKSSSDSEYEASRFPDFFKDLNNDKLKYCDSYLNHVRHEEIGKTDEGKKPYRCKTCSMIFFSRLHYKNHLKLHYDNDELVYTGWSLKIQFQEKDD